MFPAADRTELCLSPAIFRKTGPTGTRQTLHFELLSDRARGRERVLEAPFSQLQSDCVAKTLKTKAQNVRFVAFLKACFSKVAGFGGASL
jgi:hypothetical protein